VRPADGAPAGAGAAAGEFDEIERRIHATVRKVAAEDPDPTDPFRGLYISDDLALALAESGPRIGAGDRLAQVADLLGLTPLETRVLAVVAAPQLDPRYARLFAYLHDDVTRKLPSARLTARLLGGDVPVAEILRCFGADGALRRSGALRIEAGDGTVALAERGVRISDRLAAYLLGAALDDESGGGVRRVELPAYDPGRPESVHEVAALLAADAPVPVVVAGPDAAALVAHAGASPLIVLDLRAATHDDQLAAARLACRLEGRRLCFDGPGALRPEDRAAVAGALAGLDEPAVILANTTHEAVSLGDLTVLLVDAPPPTLAEREIAWRHHSGSDETREVAAKFRLSAGQIAEAAEVALMAARARGEVEPTPADLDAGARAASSSRLGELAAQLTLTHTWESLVLPDRQRDHLRSIAGHLLHRDRVLQEWGYEETITRGHGLKALFAGESGTGKTMAAQVIATELGLDLYRVDLATVVSKYIGETEKNLDRIFGAAEGSNAIIFFDEADALFGKRSEVSDAHDRYANIEVSYLLQKMEGYEGAVVLATNFQRNIDDAFLRRLDYIVDFPFPDEPDRRRIWALLLPDRAPVSADVDLDFLAERFKLAGGAIRNAALAAGYLAAAEGDEITMRHLIRAVGLEYTKLGRLTIEADFEQYHEALQ
jgi:ATPase family associated with various cellular activities (AAA)